MLGLILFATSAFAVNFLPCQREMSGDRFRIGQEDFRIAAGQVVFEGQLEPFRDAQLEGSIAWSIHDALIARLPDQPFPLVNLGHHDEVFLLDSQGQVQVSGYHVEFREPNSRGSNSPRLVTKRYGQDHSLSDEEYRQAFLDRRRAVVIATPPSHVIQMLEKHYGEHLKRIAPYQTAQSCFLPAGIADNCIRPARVHPVVDEHGRLQIQESDKWTLAPGDTLILVKAEAPIGAVEIRGLPTALSPKAMNRVAEADYGFVLRKNSSSASFATT